MQKLTLCGLAGGVVLFVWGILSWVILPWHHATIHAFSDEGAVARILETNAPRAGVYFLPNKMHPKPDPGDLDAAAVYEQSRLIHENGPLVFASVQRSGARSMPAQMAMSFLIQCVSAGLAAWLVLQIQPAGVARKMTCFAVIALLIFVFGHLPNWNWWGFSSSFTLVGLCDTLVGWLLAGAVISKMT